MPKRILVSEAARTAERITITEARPTARATEASDKPGRFVIQLITPGWGSSGFYGAQVLEAAAGPTVFPAGTHMYLDHPGHAEEYDRPERSVRDLAAVLAEDARWDGTGLVAEATVFPEFLPALRDKADAIGVSIRAFAEAKQGEADGRRGDIITALVEGISVDFVTRAGRGGEIRQVIESASARPVQRAISHGVAEATVNDLREQLNVILRDAYGGQDVWLWVRDFDDAHAWYERETPDGTGVWQHDYTVDDAGAVALAGTPIEVRVQTQYVPVVPAADSTTQEETMTPEEQAEMARLQEAAGRSSAAETARATAEAERDAARRELAEMRAREAARTHARTRVGAPTADMPAATIDRIVEAATRAVPLTDAGTLDTAALDVNVDAAKAVEETYLAGLREAAGAGKVTGFGPPAATTTTTDEARPPSRTFGRATERVGA